MSLLTRAVRNGASAFRSATPPTFGDSSIPPNSAVNFGTGPGAVTKVTGALAISTVLNCLRVLTDDFKALPFYSYTGQKHGVRQVMAQQPTLVNEPFGPDLSPSAGMAQIMLAIKARGAAYLWVNQTDRMGFPTLMSILSVDEVRATWDDNGNKVFKIGSKTYDSTQIKQLNNGLWLPGTPAGIDPLSFQRIINQQALDVAQSAGNYFQNGAMPGGIILADGTPSLSKAREIAQTFEASHAGVNNAHRPGVLFNAKYMPTPVTPENAQFLQTRQFLRTEITGWYGVPLSRINATVTERTPSQGEGTETVDIDYQKHTLLPICREIEWMWNQLIPGGNDTFVEFDFTELLRPHPLLRAQIAQVHRVTAVRSPNEIRADEGWEPYDGGDDYNAPLNSNTSGAPAGNSNDPSVQQGQDGQDTPGVTTGGGT